MKRNILSYINKLQSYRTAIKNLHWDSDSLSEHKLLDEFDGKVSEMQDEIAEVAQGIYGVIKINELRPRRYNITTSKKMMKDVLLDTINFYSTIKRSKDCIGLRSVVETFIGELNKYLYLINICLKEDIEARLQGRDRLMEEKVRLCVKEAIQKTINKEKVIKAITEQVTNHLKNVIKF